MFHENKFKKCGTVCRVAGGHFPMIILKSSRKMWENSLREEVEIDEIFLNIS
jgi:hypothetical protein